MKTFLKITWYLLLVFIVSATAAVFIYDAVSDVFALEKSGENVSVTIPDGADISEVSEIYKRAGLIKYPLIYRVYSKLRGDDGKYLAGDFSLSGALDYDGLRRAIKPGKNVRTQIKLTFPEGSDADDIIDIFIAAGIGERKKFVTAINEFDFGFDFMSGITGEGRIYRLEGYLFPDTYYFYSDSTETEAIYKMLCNFDAKFTSDMKKSAASAGFSTDEIIALASMIEKEAYYKSDMAGISSVFYNRLKSKAYPHLDCDATVVYARDAGKTERGGFPSKEDLGINSQYNTYRTFGLPPGAICSPGLAAIEAALSPAKTDYYYFLCSKEKKAVFSRTYAEHMRAVEALKSR